MPALAPFARGSSQLALAQAALVILSMGTFFPAELTVGFAAVPCFLHYFWLRCQLRPWVLALALGGAFLDPT